MYINYFYLWLIFGVILGFGVKKNKHLYINYNFNDFLRKVIKKSPQNNNFTPNIYILLFISPLFIFMGICIVFSLNYITYILYIFFFFVKFFFLYI